MCVNQNQGQRIWELLRALLHPFQNSIRMHTLSVILKIGIERKIKSFLLVCEDYYKRPGGMVGVFGKCHLGEFLRRLMCAEGMGCERRWVIRGTGTASGHPGAP